MSTYNKDKQKLVTVSNGAATPAQKQKTTAAAPAKTTAAKAQPVKYQADPVDRTQYKYDATTNTAYQQALNSLLAAQKEKPTYAGTYDGQLDKIYNQIVNRTPFTYDINQDVLYQQYRDQYAHLGRMAMRDTIGQAASLTGGYGNTYAEAVGQQQYNAYLQQLNDVVPELYGMARDQYNREGDALQNQFAMTGDLAEHEYGRYQDALNNYWQNVDYLQGEADKAYDRGYNDFINAEQMGMQQDQFNYQKELDAYQREQDAYDRKYQEQLDAWNKSFQESQFAYQKEQDSLADQWRDKEYQTQQAQIAYEKQLQAYNTLSELITATGYAPSAAELQAAGMSQAQADAYRSYYSQQQAQAAASRSSGGGGGGGGGYIAPIGDDDGDGTPQQTEAAKKAQNKNLSGDEIMKQMGTGPYATPTTYTDAISYLEKQGVNKPMSQVLKQSDWNKYKALAQKNNLLGEPGTTKYEMYSGTYADYLAYMIYHLTN